MSTVISEFRVSPFATAPGTDLYFRFEIQNYKLQTRNLFQDAGTRIILCQCPAAVVLDQGKGFHSFAAVECRLIRDTDRMTGDGRSRGLFLACHLQTARARDPELLADLLKGGAGILQRH